MARRTAQPTTPIMIAMMKPIAPSQSKSPTSVPRLAEKSGSMLLFMFGPWSMNAGTNNGAPVRFPRLSAQRALFSKSGHRHPLVMIFEPNRGREWSRVALLLIRKTYRAYCSGSRAAL